MSCFLSPRFHVNAVFMQLRRWQQCHLKERNVTLFTFSRNLDQKKEPLERDKQMKDGVLTDRKEMASFVPNLPFFTNIYIYTYIYIVTFLPFSTTAWQTLVFQMKQATFMYWWQKLYRTNGLHNKVKSKSPVWRLCALQMFCLCIYWSQKHVHLFFLNVTEFESAIMTHVQ